VRLGENSYVFVDHSDMAIKVKSSSFRVDRVTDNEVVERLQRIVAEVQAGVKQFTVLPTFSQNTIETPFNDLKYDVKSILSQDTIAISVFTLETGAGISISVRRQLDQDNQKWEPHDVISVSPSNSDIGLEVFTKIWAAARRHFSPIDRIAVLEHLTDDQRQYIEQRQLSLHRLETMQDEFFRKIQDFTVHQATAAQTNQAKLEEVFNSRATELEASHAALRKKLDDERAAFEEEKRQLDLRDSTVVRRSIRDEVKKLLSTRAEGFKLSEHAKEKTTPVFWAYIVLMMVLSGLAGFYIFKDFEATAGATASPWLIGRQVAFTLAFAITAGFFIRWLNTAAQRHVDEEFQTKKYELDFERASFVVEWAMEWAKDQRDVPQFLIERLSRGLFDSTSTEAGPATAADAVASALFGSAASAKLKLGDNEIVLDRKGISRLKRDSDSLPS
jgi:hypothetical protein